MEDLGAFDVPMPKKDPPGGAPLVVPLSPKRTRSEATDSTLHALGMREEEYNAIVNQSEYVVWALFNHCTSLASHRALPRPSIHRN